VDICPKAKSKSVKKKYKHNISSMCTYIVNVSLETLRESDNNETGYDVRRKMWSRCSLLLTIQVLADLSCDYSVQSL